MDIAFLHQKKKHYGEHAERCTKTEDKFDNLHKHHPSLVKKEEKIKCILFYVDVIFSFAFFPNREAKTLQAYQQTCMVDRERERVRERGGRR